MRPNRGGEYLQLSQDALEATAGSNHSDGHRLGYELRCVPDCHFPLLREGHERSNSNHIHIAWKTQIIAMKTALRKLQ